MNTGGWGVGLQEPQTKCLDCIPDIPREPHTSHMSPPDKESKSTFPLSWSKSAVGSKEDVS